MHLIWEEVSNKPTSSKKQNPKNCGINLQRKVYWQAEMNKLLEMLEDQVCLWNVSLKVYHLKD